MICNDCVHLTENSIYKILGIYKPICEVYEKEVTNENECLCFKAKKSKLSKTKEMFDGYSSYKNRLLSDENVKYAYRKGSNVLHDKSCHEIRLIPDEELCVSSEYIPSMKQCGECCLKAFYRINNDMSEIRQFEALIERMKINKRLLKAAYVDKMATSSVLGYILKIHIRNDTWKIKSVDSLGNVILYHNNYSWLADGTRDIGKSFHEQIEHPIPGGRALRYILNYKWEFHKNLR